LLLLGAPKLFAGILSEALISFPANTDYVEFDDLARLRKLPDYATLRKRFSGPILEQTQAVLGQLGIEENEVLQIVTGAHSDTYYGLLTGTLSRSAVEQTPAAKRMKRTLTGGADAYCGRTDVCILFVEDSLAAFGSLDSLKMIQDARRGTVLRLSANQNTASLLRETQSGAPVRGVLLGPQVQAAVADLLGGEQSSQNTVLLGLSRKIEVIGYSINLDRQTLVNATIACDSAYTATALSGLLSAIRGVNSLMGSIITAPAGAPFQIMQTSSSGKNVFLTAEAPLP
jgi:hypothetical protein